MDIMMMVVIIQKKTVNTTTVMNAILITTNHILRIQETIGGGHIGCLKELDLGVWMKKIYHISFFSFCAIGWNEFVPHTGFIIFIACQA